jgi:hypothetical protein
MITRALLGAKIEEFPKDFHATVEVDGYEVMIITEQRPSVTVSKKRGPGKGSHIVIHNPNPNLTVEEVYRKARETLEALTKK